MFTTDRLTVTECLLACSGRSVSEAKRDSSGGVKKRERESRVGSRNEPDPNLPPFFTHPQFTILFTCNCLSASSFSLFILSSSSFLRCSSSSSFRLTSISILLFENVFKKLYSNLFNKCELQPCSTYIFLSSSSCFLFLSSSSLLFLSSSICSCIFLSRSCSSSTFCFSTRCSTSFSCLFKLLTSPKYSVSIASRFIKLPCRKQIYFSFKHNQSKKKKLTSLCHFRD